MSNSQSQERSPADLPASERDRSALRIVLVEPAGPRNIGSIARAMKNFGLDSLAIVAPHCDPKGEEARQMAVHAADVLAAARVCSTLPEALRGCQRAVATTARSRSFAPPEPIGTVLPWLLASDGPAALIFGPEDRGLSNTELAYAQRFATIPTHPTYPSLNLATAVALCAYELTRPETAIAPAPAPPAPDNLAPLDQLEGYYDHLETLLLEIGYLQPHTAAARMEKFRRLYARAQLSAEEVALLRGILRQTTWAIRNS